MSESKSVIGDFSLFSDILKNSGYRNVSYGAAEIIDNAIDAIASDILIVFESNGSRIKNIGFLDNGNGMPLDVLWKSVTVGGREDLISGMSRGRRGRYGFGLPGASAAHSDIAEVYSWTKEKPGQIYKVVLNINKLNEGISKPVKCELPKPYSAFHTKSAEIEIGGESILGGVDFSTSGTLVLWKGCERVKPVTTNTVVNNYIKKDIGRMFRHFITEDQFSRDRWNKCSISTVYNLEDGKDIVAEKIKPNDPLYLMKDHALAEEGINFDLNDKISGRQFELNGSIVSVRFSLVSKDVFNKFKGQRRYDYIKKNTGISVVREGRELDLSHFAYFDYQEPRHRWWGIEIFFEKNADSFFGVPANKQRVDGLKEVKEQEDIEDAIYPTNSDIHEWPIWLSLNRKLHIADTIKGFYKIIKGEYSNTSGSGGEDNIPEGGFPEGDLTIEGTGIDDEPTTSGSEEEKHSEEAIANAIKELENIGINNPPQYMIDRFIKNNVVLSYRSLGEQAGFISVSINFGVCHLIINEDSLFYQYVLGELMGTGEKVFDDALRGTELMLLAYARCMDLNKNFESNREFPRVLRKWTQKVEEILDLHFNDG